MGNSLEKEYHMPKNSSASGGPGCMWKIFNAKRKSDGENVSVWVLQKKDIQEKIKSTNECNKLQERIKEGSKTLTKLRHPQIIHVNKALIETKQFFALETESIFASISNIQRNFSNIDNISVDLDKYELDNLDIQLGLLDISEGLMFLHEKAHITHRNLTPENIYITTTGKWKIAGFDFSTVAKDLSEPNTFDYNTKKTDYSIPLRPSLHYLAPETAFLRQIGFKSDMWSLGVLIWELFNKKDLIKLTDGRLEEYKSKVENLQPISSPDKIPPGLHAVVRELLSIDPISRMGAVQFRNCGYFGDQVMRSIVYLNEIAKKDIKSKVIFFQGLATSELVLPSLSSKALKQRILPALKSELCNKELISPIIPNLLWMMSEDVLSSEDIQKLIIPIFINLFGKNVTIPPKARTLLLPVVPKVLPEMSKKEVINVLLPFFFDSMDHKHPKVIDEALKQIPLIIPLVDYVVVKEAIIPRLKTIANTTSVNAHRARIVIAFNALVPVVDRKCIEELFLPTLLRLHALDPDPVLLLRIVQTYETLSIKGGPAFTAQCLLPVVVSYTYTKSLSESQFAFIMNTAEAMLKRIKDEKEKEFIAKKEVEEEEAKLSTVQKHNQNTLSSSPSSSSSSSSSYNTTTEDTRRIEERKEQMKKGEKSNNIDLKPKEREQDPFSFISSSTTSSSLSTRVDTTSLNNINTINTNSSVSERDVNAFESLKEKQLMSNMRTSLMNFQPSTSTTSSALTSTIDASSSSSSSISSSLSSSSSLPPFSLPPSSSSLSSSSLSSVMTPSRSLQMLPTGILQPSTTISSSTSTLPSPSLVMNTTTIKTKQEVSGSTTDLGNPFTINNIGGGFFTHQQSTTTSLKPTTMIPSTNTELEFNPSFPNTTPTTHITSPITPEFNPSFPNTTPTTHIIPPIIPTPTIGTGDFVSFGDFDSNNTSSYNNGSLL